MPANLYDLRYPTITYTRDHGPIGPYYHAHVHALYLGTVYQVGPRHWIGLDARTKHTTGNAQPTREEAARILWRNLG